MEGSVLRVSDGDGLEIRFRVRGTRRVRLAYMDAPELNQPWGAEARDALSGLVGGVGGRVEVKALERDRHGRLIAEVRARREAALQLLDAAEEHYFRLLRESNKDRGDSCPAAVASGSRIEPVDFFAWSGAAEATCVRCCSGTAVRMSGV